MGRRKAEAVKMRQKAMLAEGMMTNRHPEVAGENELGMSEEAKRPVWLEDNAGVGEAG